MEMIMSVILSNLFEVIGSIITIIVSYYVIPAIRDQLIPLLKEKRLYDIVYRTVMAAEKLGATDQIKKADKKIYVISILKKKGIKITPEVESLIETACKEIDLITLTTLDVIQEGAEG